MELNNGLFIDFSMVGGTGEVVGRSEAANLRVAVL